MLIITKLDMIDGNYRKLLIEKQSDDKKSNEWIVAGLPVVDDAKTSIENELFSILTFKDHEDALTAYAVYMTLPEDQ